jgi:hypothetical protein
MRFRSAKEDLHETTLAALPGRLERLGYLADLRLESGAYEHWGMTRVYGDAPAQAVLKAAHFEALDALLRTPLAELFAEAEQQEVDFERPAAELLPPTTDVLRAAHFSLVWDALASVKRRRASHRPAA